MPAPKSSLKPLLQFVEEIDNAIHQNPSDSEVAKIIKENFSPDLSVLENETIINFVGFKTFNTDFRKEFLSLEILDSKAVTFKADPEGIVGVVGFAQTFLFEKKSDGQLSTGDTVEIFEVAFVPEKENAPGRKRMITKAFAAFGDMTPIPSSHVVARTSKTKGRIDSKSRSAHSIATQKTRAAAPRGITKKRSATKNRK